MHIGGRLPRFTICALLGLVILPGAARSQPQAPPPAVTVVPVPVRDVAPVYSFIGRVLAIQSVQIQARVTAFIQDVPVDQGSDVRAGEVLFELQRSQYETELQSAQAQLAAAQAALRQSEAAYGRAAQLVARGVEAQANLDRALAERDQDQADVQAAQARIAQSALNLSYTIITSPIDGRIGAINLTRGNLLTPATPPLATVNQLDPIRVVFSVSDPVRVGLRQSTGATEQQLSAERVVFLTLPDGSEYPHLGRVAFLGNEVDLQTGTVSVYADFANPDHLLLPGAFVRVRVRRETPQERPLVPIAAVQSDRSGDYVLVVQSDNTVAQRPISLGRQIEQDFIVESGLSGGERVIIAGVQKVRPGLVVTPSMPAAAERSAAVSRGG